ncbi:MAG: ribonuclease P protein component [Anaerolineae bacterium]|nr:ribonuclease P protein component [Anaerolineae bacterium]MEB2287354.1 ribonuclease P protein component [Anaerolineae bacterium]
MQRHLRLRRNEDFARLRQEGRAWQHPLLILSVAPNGLAHNRYGFVTSKRLGTAVVRNRIRRLLREAVREVHAHLRPGHDIAFVARPRIAGQPFQVVRQAVSASLQRAGLYSPPAEESSS